MTVSSLYPWYGVFHRFPFAGRCVAVMYSKDPSFSPDTRRTSGQCKALRGANRTPCLSRSSLSHPPSPLEARISHTSQSGAHLPKHASRSPEACTPTSCLSCALSLGSRLILELSKSSAWTHFLPFPFPFPLPLPHPPPLLSCLLLFVW